LDGESMPKAGPVELSPPAGAFLIGWLDGEPVCCGGVKRLDRRTCEIKKMYVVPARRGQGVGRALLPALGDQDRGRGHGVARPGAEPGALPTIPSPIDIEHAEPWGVSCTKRSCSLTC